MKRSKKSIIYLFIVLLCLSGWPSTSSAAGSVSAHSAILMEQKSGRVLYAKNADQVSRIASITKIMTAILAIESGKINKTVTVSHSAVGVEG
ncbi:D-alanyl-D-alanine carboxypeptidase, partial [Priestia megaterium]